MQDAAKNLVQVLPDNDHLLQLAENLRQWLVADLNHSEEPVPDFTESRAKALLRAADLLDDPTRHSLDRLLEHETAVRVALFDLLQESELAEEETVGALAATTAVQQLPEAAAFDQWLSLFVAAYAWKSGYPLFQLDPASPPDPYSPAGQVLKRAAYFVRRQVQRSATERDKLGRQLAYSGLDRPPGLDQLNAEGPIAPLPPHYRSPIPVRYPEVSRETLQVDPDSGAAPADVTRGEPITITDSDLQSQSQPPTYREPIQINAAEPVPPSTTRVVTPNAAVSTGSTFSRSVRKRYGRGKGSMKTTKLEVIVQEYPDGPGLYGLQVRVSCKGIKSHVAGTTSREGKFTCELPVPENTGLTYDIDLSWPREMGGETERKSITLNADRTRFTLPFFHQLSQESDN
ncbi:MAG: hypothetical protein ACK2T4_00230 [Candidatus Promineifilaceae bacterium]|jgi:hypothetical protein